MAGSDTHCYVSWSPREIHQLQVPKCHYCSQSTVTHFVPSPQTQETKKILLTGWEIDHRAHGLLTALLHTTERNLTLNQFPDSTSFLYYMPALANLIYPWGVTQCVILSSEKPWLPVDNTISQRQPSFPLRSLFQLHYCCSNKKKYPDQTQHTG